MTGYVSRTRNGSVDHEITRFRSFRPATCSVVEPQDQQRHHKEQDAGDHE
jgi:hypothetical protein